jgi:hypothetical protein
MIQSRAYAGQVRMVPRSEGAGFLANWIPVSSIFHLPATGSSEIAR